MIDLVRSAIATLSRMGNYSEWAANLADEAKDEVVEQGIDFTTKHKLARAQIFALLAIAEQLERLNDEGLKHGRIRPDTLN
jgi:hypothetical protein